MVVVYFGDAALGSPDSINASQSLYSTSNQPSPSPMIQPCCGAVLASTPRYSPSWNMRIFVANCELPWGIWWNSA